jgi:hypothetical protein
MKAEKIHSVPFIRLNLTMEEAKLLKSISSCSAGVGDYVDRLRHAMYNTCSPTKSEYQGLLSELWRKLNEVIP